MKQPIAILVTVDGFRAPTGCPQFDDQRREGEDHERVERLEPCDRDLALPEQKVDRAVGIAVGP